MRLSINQSDPGFRQGARANVFLNGEPVRRCITADEEAGFVIVHKADDTGRVLIANGELVEETLYGAVIIEVIHA